MNKSFITCITVVVCAVIMCSCSKSKTEKDSDYNKKLVISELMTDNEATLFNQKGVPEDWIEVANISDSEISLNGMQLMSCKGDSASADSAKTWSFPDKTIAAGEHVVVFIGKDKDSKKEKEGDNEDENENEEEGSEMKANLKFYKKGGCMMLLNSNGNILSDMPYGKLGCDESLQRLADSSIVKSSQPTPGFANDKAGVAAFMATKKSNDALQIWEVKPQAPAIDQWIELKNTSKSAINLSAYCLTNKAKDLSKWKLPNVTLSPGAFYIIHAAGKRRANKRVDWATFKLSDNDAVLLTKNGKIVDAMSGQGAFRGQSRGRIAGKTGFFYFQTATQGTENNQKGYMCIATPATMSQKTGVYKEKTLTVEIKGGGNKVHYTLDGSEPSATSPVYSSPLKLAKSTTVRYYTEGDETTMRSPTQTCTYILGEQHKLGVLNITIPDSALFGQSNGIYVEGNHPPKYWVKTKKNGEVKKTNTNANYLQKWTKLCHAEFLDGGEGFSVDCGLRIFGAGSRSLPKKSMSLKFDAAYGPSSVEYDFFNTGKAIDLQDVVLRSGSTDQMGVMVRDEFFTSLFQEESPTMLTQLYRPIVLYVNCQYWGVFYFREKIDRHFVGRKLNVSTDSVSIMRANHGEEGDISEFVAIQNYVTSHDMTSQEAYNYVDKHVSLTSLIDNKIGQMYSGNTDIYNVRQVRALDKKGDNKWYYIFYDIDESFTSMKPMGFYLRASFTQGIGSQPVRFCNTMIDKMLTNPKFRGMFLEHLSHHIHKTLDTKHLQTKFDKMINDIRPEMQRECARWGEMKFESWERHVQTFRTRLVERKNFMLNGVKQELRITPEECKKYNL